MGGLDPVYIDIVVCEYGAAYRRNAYCLLGESHLGNHLGEELMDHAVAAAGAVMHVHFLQKLRFAVNLVLFFDNIFYVHFEGVG